VNLVYNPRHTVCALGVVRLILLTLRGRAMARRFLLRKESVPITLFRGCRRRWDPNQVGITLPRGELSSSRQVFSLVYTKG